MKQQKRGGAHYASRKKVLDSIKELMTKSPSSARAQLSREIDEHPDDMYCLHYHGLILMSDGNYEEAQAAFERVHESDSRNRYAGLVGMAEIARIKGNISEAMELYQMAIDEHPEENRSTYYMLARLKRGCHQYEEAIRILKLAEDCNETRIELIIAYVEAGNLEAANEISKLVVPADDKERRSLAYANGRVQIASENYELAAAFFQEARSGQEKDAIYYKTLFEEAKLAVEMGNYQLAVDDCEEVISAKVDGYSELHMTLGRAKQGLGQYQEAITCYEKGLKSAFVPKILKSDCAHRLASLQLISGDTTAAETTLKSYSESGVPIGLFNVDLLLNIYITQGRYDEAKELIGAAKAIYKDTGDAKERLSFARKIVDAFSGKLDKSKRDTFHVYRQRQVVDYDKKEAIAHIIERHQRGDEPKGNFAQNIDISSVYDDVQLQLLPENKTAGELLDRYYIDYPAAGYYPNGEIINRICAIVIPGTKNILTMYPDNGCQMVTGKDMAATVNKQNVKTTPSRSDRFKKRFGL